MTADGIRQQRRLDSRKQLGPIDTLNAVAHVFNWNDK
jgi:hypothetical protein